MSFFIVFLTVPNNQRRKIRLFTDEKFVVTEKIV